MQIFGPYAPSKGRTRWRVQLYDPTTKTKRSITVPTREEAELLIPQLRDELARHAPLSCHDALEQYLAYKATYVSHLTAASLRDRLTAFLPDLPLSQITEAKAQQIYLAETRRVGKFGQVKAATHHARLRNTREFFRWLQKKGLCHSNPFEKVDAIGRANAGKPQPTETDAKKLDEVLFSAARAGEEGALALLVQLYLGLRSSEALKLRVGAVEREGRKVTIERGKSKNARRALELYPDVAALLWKFCQDRPADERVFARNLPRCPAPAWMYKRLHHYCQLAGIPQFCPHSLRGLHSSLALVGGATTYQVAASLGHASFATTAKHYADASAIDNSRARRFAETIRQGDALVAELAQLVGSLSAEQKARLRALLDG